MAVARFKELDGLSMLTLQKVISQELSRPGILNPPGQAC